MSIKRITIAHGDGIGPEIMAATLDILEAADAALDYDTIEIGQKLYESGNSAGIAEDSWESLVTNGVFLKAPITTPQGGGYKSLNVTVRKTLGMYANVRPCKSYAPFVKTKHPDLDVIIIRENEEDLYAGIEHRQTEEVYQCLKLITRPGSEKICRYAFEHARRAGRKKVTCFVKDNIMKLTDGLFHKVFDEVAAEYPDIEKEHWIVDIGTALIADEPERFDVVVLPNLYGDIISDVVAQLTGSVGLGGSANIGEHCAMFEAIHGSAPTIAGQDIANPSGILLGAIQMLVHIGQGKVAEKIHNAWLKTIEDGVHTADLHDGSSKGEAVGTQAFGKAVVERLGEEPSSFAPVRYTDQPPLSVGHKPIEGSSQKELVGVDIFICEDKRDADELGARLERAIANLPINLQMITNRGVKVWPKGRKETFCTDHWRCRMTPKEGDSVGFEAIWQALQSIHEAGLEVIKTENLYTFDGERGFSLGQGQ